MKKVFMFSLLVAMIVALGAGQVFSYLVPQDDSQVKYFYVFGPDGNSEWGAEDHELTLYIDVPQDEVEDVVVRVYDPDVGGVKDWRSNSDNPWDTATEFSVSGAKVLDKKEFGSGDYNRDYYQFGPYKKTQGEKVGDAYRFSITAKGIKGDDANLFKVEVSPESAATFSYNITFRLLPIEGENMYFYPEIPAGTDGIIVDNYDLDKEGGMSALFDPATSEAYAINDSESGKWSQTAVPIKTDAAHRLDYVITKSTQRQAHAGLKITDSKGTALPIYFRKKAEPVTVVAQKPAPKTAPKPKPVPKPVAKPAPKPAPKPKPEPPKEGLKCNTFTFDARSSYDVDKQDLSFVWDFGDGQMSTESVATHVYDTAGEYTVSLTVKDDSGMVCDTASAAQTIEVNTPPTAAFAADTLACVGQAIAFDASSTTDNAVEQVSYMWNFGDGIQADGQKVSKVYEKGGLYKVTLAVDDNAGSTCSTDNVQQTVRINTPPVANAGEDISMCLKSQDEPYKVMLNAGRSKDADGNDLVYAWDFGDGITGRGVQSTHVYAKGGTYTAKVTISDESGSACSANSDTVMIDLSRSPIANAGDDANICLGDTVDLDGTASVGGDGEALAYTWDFGDGITDTGAKPRHKYAKGGKYKVTLNVDNGKGTGCSEDSDSLDVVVNSQPTVALEDVGMYCVGDTVALNASGSRDADGDSLDYAWDFGDGATTDGGSRISHKYAKGGTYKVSVVGNDGQGFSCSSASASIAAKINTPPVADAGPNLACCVGEKTMFEGSGSTDADGNTLTYVWDFGDGASAKGAKVSHVYVKSGEYKVSLTVNDNSGTSCNSSVDSFVATVNEKPVPVIKIR
ncbi:PKD domain-containing protein [Candidatus Omnitrophota bacterium]